MAGWEEKGFDDDELHRKYKDIFYRIQAKQAQFKHCSPDDPEIEALLHEIARLSEAPGGLAAAWPLAMYLASCRLDNHLNYHARKYVEEWADEELSAPAERVFYISSAYYVIGERSAAVRLIRNCLSGKPEESIIVAKLRLNLLYYLIEEAVYSSYRASEIRLECDRIMRALPFDDLNKLTDEKMRCAAVDTLGYYKIVFGETKHEIEEGIRLCQKAYPEGAAERMGGYYGVLHQRTGWRRYLRARQ
jgi:hypothetical protein